MGNCRKTKERINSTTDEEIDRLVQGMAFGLQMGMVHLPKFIHVYKLPLMIAFDGNLQPLELTLQRLGERDKKFSTLTTVNALHAKWIQGMRDAMTDCYYVLSMFHQILTTYHRKNHGRVIKIPPFLNYKSNGEPDCKSSKSKRVPKSNRVQLEG